MRKAQLAAAFGDDKADLAVGPTGSGVALAMLLVAEQMRSRGPRAVVVNIPGCGHAPALNVPDQLALIERFLVSAA